MDNLSTIWVVCIFLLVCWFWYLGVRKKQWINDENMPKELVQGMLYKNERPIHCNGPFPFHGVPDQEYITQNGVWIPLDTKSRNLPFIYRSDVIQLSVYAYIYRHKRNSIRIKSISPYGYIRLVKGGKNPEISYKQVTLLTDIEIENLAIRLANIKAGKVDSLKKGKKGLCRQCDYRHESCSQA